LSCAPFAPGRRIEQAAIVGGRAVYGIDVKAPGMVHAALRQAPVHGGRLKSFDADKVRAMPGVLAVVAIDPTEPRGLEANGRAPMAFPFFTAAPQAAVAVIAEHYWQAKIALDALPVEWDDGAGTAWKDDAQVARAAEALLATPSDKPLFEAGKPEEAQGRRVRADYRAPYADQVQMEPLNGMARVTDGGVEVWAPTQNILQSVWIAADEARVPLANVTHHQPLVGGAFGRRTMADDTRMVVAVARKFPGRPVKLIWSREECVRQGRYRPYAAARMEAVLGDDGLPKALTVRAAQAKGFPPIGLADSPFLRGGGIPAVRVEAQTLDMHLLTGSFRGPSYSSYAFMIESFLDECALAAGLNPVDYRLKLLEGWPDPGWAAALKAAAAKANFGKKLPRGEGQGIAVANWGGYGRPKHGTTAAAVAEVAVTRQGELTIKRIDVAFDSGKVLDADNVRQQLTGATLFGLNVALNEALSIKDGAIVQGNYVAYPVRRIGDTPDIHIHFDALTGDDRYGEIGEVGVGPVSAAVANAIFRATGKRVRSQPFRAHDLSWS
jgi:isoquinoline 1-oxidoreductase beta subunit